MPAKPTSDSAVSDDIFELTDIVERGNLDVADADLDAELGSDLSPSDDASFEQELEDLFSEDGADSGGQAQEADSSDVFDGDITDLGEIAEPVASADDDLDFDAMIEQAAAGDDAAVPKDQDLLPELEEELDFSDIDLDEELEAGGNAKKKSPSKDPFEDFDIENLDISDADTAAQKDEDGLDVESFFDDDLDLGDKATGGDKDEAVDEGFDLMDLEPADDKQTKKITAPDAFDLEGLDNELDDLGIDADMSKDDSSGTQDDDAAALAESLDDFDLDGLEEELDGLDLDGESGADGAPSQQSGAGDAGDDLFDGLDFDEEPAAKPAAPKAASKDSGQDSLDFDDLDDVLGDLEDSLEDSFDSSQEDTGTKVKDSIATEDFDIDGLDDDLADALEDLGLSDALEDLGLSDAVEAPKKQKPAPAKKEPVAEEADDLEGLDAPGADADFNIDDLDGLDGLGDLDGLDALGDTDGEPDADLDDDLDDDLDGDLTDALDDLGLSDAVEAPKKQKPAPAKKEPVAEEADDLKGLDALGADADFNIDDLDGLDGLGDLDGLDALGDTDGEPDAAPGDDLDGDLDGDLTDALDDLGLSDAVEAPRKQKPAAAKKEPVAEEADDLEGLDALGADADFNIDDLDGLDGLGDLDGLDALGDTDGEPDAVSGDAALDDDLDDDLDGDLTDALDDLGLSEAVEAPKKQKPAAAKKEPVAEEADELEGLGADTDFDLEGALEGLDLETGAGVQDEAAESEPFELDALPVEHVSGADSADSVADESQGAEEDQDADDDIMSVTLPDEDESGSELFAEESDSYEVEEELADDDIDISGLNELIEDLNLPDEEAGDIGDELDDAFDEDLDEQPEEQIVAQAEDVLEEPELAGTADDVELAALAEPERSASEDILPAGDEDDLDIDDIDTSDLDLILQEVEEDDLSGGPEPLTQEADPDSLPFELQSEDEAFQELLREDTPAETADLSDKSPAAAAKSAPDAVEILAEEADELMTDMDGAVHAGQQFNLAEQETLEADRSLKAPSMIDEGPLLVESDTEDFSLQKQPAGNGADDFDQSDIDAAFSRSAVAALHDIQELYGKIDGLEMQLAKANDTDALAQSLEESVLQKVDALVEDRLASRLGELERALEEKYKARVDALAEILEQQIRARLMATVEEKLLAGEALYEKIAEGLRPEIAAALQQYGSRFVQHGELTKNMDALQEELDKRIAKAAPMAAATVIREELAALIKEGLL